MRLTPKKKLHLKCAAKCAFLLSYLFTPSVWMYEFYIDSTDHSQRREWGKIGLALFVAGLVVSIKFRSHRDYLLATSFWFGFILIFGNNGVRFIFNIIATPLIAVLFD